MYKRFSEFHVLRERCEERTRIVQLGSLSDARRAPHLTRFLVQGGDYAVLRESDVDLPPLTTAANSGATSSTSSGVAAIVAAVVPPLPPKLLVC